LSPFITPVIPNEYTVLMHLKQFSDQAISSAGRFQSLWKNRLEISDPTASTRMGAKKVAA
ncbi:MAG: hypothetical protein ABIQ95_16270, partial [Bdellovibrionia bacterium]